MKITKSCKKKLNKIRPEVWLIFILIFALFLRLWFFVGPNMNDDIDYIFSAHEVANGRYYPLYGGSINAIRSMMTIPIALFFELFGVSILTAAIYPLLCSLITIIATFYIGKILVNYKVGLFSAFILSFFPVDVAYSTQLVPTTPVTMFITIGLLLFLYGEKTQKKKTKIFFFTLTGILMGLSYLVNIITLIIIIGFALSYFLFKRKIKKEYLLVILGFLLVFSGEALFMYINTQNPWHRLDVIHETEKMIGTNTDMSYYPRVMLKIENVNFNIHEGNLGIYVYIFIAASFFTLIIKPEKKLWFLIIAFILIMSYLQFGVMTSEFKPIAKWIRYLIIFGPIFSLLIGYMFEKITNKNYFQITLLVLFFIVTIPYIIGSTYAYKSWTYEFREEYNYLKNLPEKIIYTDQGSKGFLEFYFGYKKNIKNLEGRELEEIKDSYVIVDGSRGVVYFKPMRDRIPEFVRNPPENWKLFIKIKAPLIEPKIYNVI